MKNLIKIFLLTLLISLNIVWAQRIELEVGQQQTVFISGLKRLDYTGPIKVEQVGDKLLVIGQSPGSGSIVASTIYGVETREVIVYARSPQRVIDDLTALLKDIEGVRFRKAGDRVLAEGTLRSDSDRIVFNKIMALYPDVINLVVGADLPIEISAVIVEVEVQSSKSLKVLDNSGVSGEAEINGGMPLRPRGDPTADLSFTIATSVKDALSSLIEAKKAKVVGKTCVVTISGKKATILSGGEVPYQVTGTAGVGVEWKKYGLKLDVTPERRPAGEIFMDMHVESSEPTKTEFGPSLNSRTADVQISVENKKTIIIGGLFNTISGSSAKAGCLIPSLGASSQTVKKEILILVTPSAPPTINYDDFKQIKSEDIK